MSPDQRRWLRYALATGAITSSIVSLFALVVMGGPRWTISLNVVAIVLVVLAAGTRGPNSGANDG